MRNNTTWNNLQGTWKSGKTQTIRVPIKLVPEIIKFARYLDNGIHPAGDAYAEFLLIKEKQYKRSNKTFNRLTPRWAVFNEFEYWLKNCQSVR